MPSPIFIIFTAAGDPDEKPNLKSCFGDKWQNFNGDNPVLFVNSQIREFCADNWDIAVIWQDKYRYRGKVLERIKQKLLTNIDKERPVCRAFHAGSKLIDSQDKLIRNLYGKLLSPQRKEYHHDDNDIIYQSFIKAIEKSGTPTYQETLRNLSGCFFRPDVFSFVIEIFVTFLPHYIYLQMSEQANINPNSLGKINAEDINRNYENVVKYSKLHDSSLNIDEKEGKQLISELADMLKIENQFDESITKKYCDFRDHLVNIVKQLQF